MLKRLASAVPLLLLLALPALAQPPGAPVKDAKPEEKRPLPPPEEKSSVTRHSLTLDGKAYPYTATAGTLLLRNDEGTVTASVFYIAYTLDGVKDPASRPVTFSFNGGPGAASLWVHLGAFGPKRVARTDEGFALPPPGKLVDNENSILDASDLVFIDPVSTGYSRPAPGQDPKQFHGVKAGHRVGRRLHPPLGHPQRALGLAQVRGRRELRHHPRGRPRLPPRGPLRHDAQRRRPRSPPCSTGRTRTSTPATTSLLHPSADLRRRRLVPQEAPAGALGGPAQDPGRGRGLRPRRVRAGPAPGGPPARRPAQGDRGQVRPLHRPLAGLRRALEPLRPDRPLRQGAAARRGEDHRPPRHPLHRHRHRFGGRDLRVRSRHRLPRRPLRRGDQRLHPPRPQVRERPRLRAADRQGLALELDLPQPVRERGRSPAPGDDPQPPPPGADDGRRLRPRDPLLRRLLHPRPPGAAEGAAGERARSSSTRRGT